MKTTDIRHMSSTSLSEIGKGTKKFKRHGLSMHQSGITHHPSTADLTHTVSKSSYFSDINPRNMRRLMNIVSVTGRLLRAFTIEFSWHKVAAWINLTEQWPYRSSWIILEAEDDTYEDNTPLKKVYDNVLSKLPQSREIEPLLEIDKNPSKLLLFLSNHQPNLTVGDVKKFLTCTINVDPYLRKLIKELKENAENPTSDTFGMMGSYGPESIAPGGSYSNYSRPRSRHGSGGLHAGTNMDRTTRVPSRGVMLQPHPYSQMAMMQHLAAPVWHPSMSHSGMDQTNLAPASTSKSYLKMKHLDPSIRLSRMGIEEVCKLVHKLVGLKDSVIPDLKEKIRDNNINGVVLVNCNLQELKPVLGLSFGDWEIFRSYIETLRDREEEGYDEEDSVDPVTGRFDSKPPTSNSHSTCSIIIAPKPIYAKDKEVGRERFKVQKVNIEDTSPSSDERHQLTTPDDKSTNSVMGEFMYESQTLHSVMSTMGIDDIDRDQSDNDDSVDENQATVIRTESRVRPLGTNIDWPEGGPNSNNSQLNSSIDSTLNEIFEEDPLIQPKKHKSKKFWSRSRSASKNSLAKSESSVTSDLELTTYEKKQKKKKGHGKGNNDLDDEIVRLTSDSDCSDKVSLLMPGTSQEKLFKQSIKGAEGNGPSAFATVTPVLSRASSGSAFSSHFNSRHHSIDSLQADLDHIASQQSSAYPSRQGSTSSSRRESMEASGGRKGGPSSAGNVDEKELREIVVEMACKQSQHSDKTSYL